MYVGFSLPVYRDYVNISPAVIGLEYAPLQHWPGVAVKLVYVGQ